MATSGVTVEEFLSLAGTLEAQSVIWSRLLLCLHSALLGGLGLHPILVGSWLQDDGHSLSLHVLTQDC